MYKGWFSYLIKDNSFIRLTSHNQASGGGQVVSVLGFHSDNLVRIPWKPTVITVKFVFKKTQKTRNQTAVAKSQ